MAAVRRTRAARRLVPRPLPCPAGQAGTRRPRPPALRAPPRRSQVAPGKSLDNFDFRRLPGLSERLVRVLANDGDWIDDGHNIVVLGPLGTGKSHLAAGIGIALVERGYRVLYARVTDLVQKLQAARRDYALEAAIRRLHKFHLVVLDDIAYVDKDRDETSALFELVGTRYEHRSLMVTTNQPFSAWERIFADKAMTIAAVDRLVHHAHILTLEGESYRRQAAFQRAAGADNADSTK